MSTKVLLLSPFRDGMSEENWAPMTHVQEVRTLFLRSGSGFGLIGPRRPINMDWAGWWITEHAAEIDERTVVYIDGHSYVWDKQKGASAAGSAASGTRWRSGCGVERSCR
ncbi:hypothetical protein [Cellulosimicrobium sp. 22601]|uniref:hypothetical protein n=1 Tax=unclassified Cellulosimicrobium TaxID=2624466 RepID=UPI003F828739